jgi:hypothetical protein
MGPMELKAWRERYSWRVVGSQRLERWAYHATAHGISERMTSFGSVHSLRRLM